MSSPTTPALTEGDGSADWHRRVVGRSLGPAAQRSIDRGLRLVRAAAMLLERSDGDGFTVQDVADEAGQSLRTLYQYFASKDDLLLAVFEEAMQTYADMIRDAVVDLDDPLERLAGSMIAALRMHEVSGSGVERSLARLRLKLSEVEPDLVARSQEPVTRLMRDAVAAAAASGQIEVGDADGATFVLLALRSAFLTSQALGNDHGVELPSFLTLVALCLRALGAHREPAWFEAISDRLKMPGGRVKLGGRPKASRR